MVIEQEIRQKISDSFPNQYLDLINESHMHHMGSESHFKLTLVSDEFEGKRLVQRHQSVYKVLSEQMPKIHALALHLYTDSEWNDVAESPASPQCRGGGKF